MITLSTPKTMIMNIMMVMTRSILVYEYNNTYNDRHVIFFHFHDINVDYDCDSYDDQDLLHNIDVVKDDGDEIYGNFHWRFTIRQDPIYIGRSHMEICISPQHHHYHYHHHHHYHHCQDPHHAHHHQRPPHHHLHHHHHHQYHH